MEFTAATKLTSRGQVTIPKRIRDALGLTPGCAVEISIDSTGRLVIEKAVPRPAIKPDRFDRVRGTADIKWRTDDLMAILRGED